MDADSAWDRLVAESGDDVDIATMVAQSNIEDAQKALDKAKKQTPKLVGTTEEKLATAKAFKESVVKAQNDLAKWQEIADVPKRRASLQTEQTDLQTESQGQQVADKLPASEEVGPTETTLVEEVAQIEESAPIEEQTKGDVSTMSQETDQVSDQVEEEKDVIEELRERNRVGNERDQRAGRPPRPSDYIEAIGKGDDKAMKAWEGEFNDYAQKLNADDLPDIESTIRQMQGHIDTIRSGNPKGYKDNSAYKAYSGIKKMLEKRRRELNKQSTENNTRLSARSNVGLVEDARTRTLGDKTRKMLDAMAKRLGLQVEFVDEIVTGKDKKGNNTYANADIVGNKVRIAWDKRDQALDFLLGHEFTHRMQDLSPEAYAEFVEAAKQALGEKEWGKRINRMKSLYKQHGIAISEQGIIDEVVADYAGELVEERGVFDNFVERNKSNRSLLSKIADVLRSIKEFFTLGKQRKINNAIARLEALIESASEANVDKVDMAVNKAIEQSGKVRFSAQELQQIEDANAKFNEELIDFGEKKHVGLLHLGKPMKILQVSGVNVEEMTISPSVLYKHLKQHNLVTDDLLDLARAVQFPILVYKHGESHPNIVVVTELDVKGGKLSIALKLDENGEVVEVSNVSSVHSKDALTELSRLSLLEDDVLRNNLRWVEKEKVSDWLGLPYEEERQANPKLDSVAKIINEFENPTISEEKNEEKSAKAQYSLQGNSLTEEEQRIADEAKANGTYLKAPNGKASNLNERQWVQVRTKAFKDWFGDWENDPENASKVVDENGEPKVVYHQTNRTIYRNVENGKLWDDLDWQEKQEWEERDDWDEYWVEEDFYEFSRTNARTTNEFDGFFFAPKYDEYHEYGDRTIEAFLNIRKPASQADYNIDAQYNDAGKKERIRLQEEGYDGVIRMEGDEVDEYIAFEPTQIKSATDNVGTFDASNPDIRYSLFGGNSGYVGYSMSKRAARAREEGRYPKTNFRKEYGVTAKSFDELVDAKIIASGEWHHTSKFGNETKFYHWDEDYYADIYEENKAVIDKLSRERKTDEIVSLFENHPLAHKAEYDNETERLVDDVNREYNDKIREVENEKRDKERAYNSAVFDALGQLTNVVKTNNGNLWFNASNGVGIQIDSAGNEVSMNYGGANGSKGALRYEARNELQTAIESVAKESNIKSADATYYTDKVNQLNSERAERVAQLVEAREKEYTPEARYSLASDMARDAVMTALEGAGIDVEMATPEMVEDVLRARDAEFHIAYHGSGAKFDEFDHSHMGEGEGAQAYGWGTYLTEVEGIAKGYAKAYDTSQTLGERDWEQLNENIADTLSEEIGIELPIEVGWTGNGFEVFERVLRSNYDPNNVMKKEHYEALADYFNYDLDSYEGDYDEFWNEVEYDLIDVATKIAKRLEEEMETPKPMLYTVEIPDDTGSNYLDYDKEMSKKELNEVRNKLEAILAEGDYKGVEKELKRELDSVFVDGLTASDVYGNVSAYLGGDKQASEFFNEMGYVGIKYPANYRSGGNEDGKKNFVIFNDSDMTITDRVEFLQTPDGTVYGWTIGGKIFLTEQGMNAETPIHEYTHLWANAMRRNNEQGWESVKDLLRGTPMWDEVLADKNYSNIHDNEDLVASEVLSRYSGKENAKRLEDEAQRMIDEAKGIGAKADAVSLIDRVRRALQKFWDWVGKDVFGIKDFDNIEQVTDRVLYDLMNHTDLNAEVSEGEANPIAEKEVENVVIKSSENNPLPKTREDAFKYMPEGGVSYVNKDQNKSIRASRNTIKHSNLHGDKNGYALFTKIKDVIEGAVKIGDIPILENKKHKTNSIGVFYVPVNIDDIQYSVRMIVKELINYGLVLEELSLYDVNIKRERDSQYLQLNAPTELGSVITEPQSAYKVKDLIHNSKEQDKKLLGISNKTKFSLQGGRSIADKYEKKVNTKGKGGALHLSKFNFMEAWQDEMRALKEVQRIIEQEYGIVLESYEDAYMAENAMSSIAKASWDRYINEVYEPMMRIHDEWIRSGESNESINHYLIAKSGLERNREFTVRDAFRAERASMEEPIRDAYRSAIKDLNEKYKPMELDLLNQYRSGAIDKDTYRNERKNLSDAKKAERKPIDDKYQLDMQDVHDKMTQVEEEYKAKRNALRDDLKAGNIGFAEFCRLSDDLVLQYSGAEEIADYSGLTALAKIYGRDDFYNFAMGMVDAFERRHSNTDVMWEHINNNTKAAVDYSYKSGITSKQAKEHLDQMFVWYVPMKGNADVEAEDIYTYVNDKSSSFTPTVARAKGHTKYVSEDVMALIANTMQSAILQGERNKVKQKFLNMVQNYPTDLISVDNGWVELQGNDWVEVFPDINENDTPEEVRNVLPHQFYNLQIFYILLIDYKTNNRSLIMPTLLPGCSRIYVQ